jgi:predicted nucleic acid-binding protein
MRKGAIFDSSFWVHAVYLDVVDFLLADYTLLCPQAVAKELGRENPTSLRLKGYVSTKTIELATPRTARIVLYGDGEREAINLALERQLVLLIDDWRPYEAARAAGIAVVNTPAYLVQLYHQERLSLERTLGDFARLTRRGTLKPEWLHAALTMVAKLHKKEKDT